jgi:hypothetical protein
MEGGAWGQMLLISAAKDTKYHHLPPAVYYKIVIWFCTLNSLEWITLSTEFT